MSNTYTGITLADAGLFSDLAYAPVTSPNAIAWGLSGKNGANAGDLYAANLLALGLWTDVTASVVQLATPGGAQPVSTPVHARLAVL